MWCLAEGYPKADGSSQNKIASTVQNVNRQ